MRPKGSASELEVRRRIAARMLRAGRRLAEVARSVGASVSSVHRWKQMYKQKGEEGLKANPHQGAPPKLSRAQKRRLVQLLLKGPKVYGFSTELWTGQRIAQVIRKHFGGRYHKDYIGRVVHSLDWTPQRPERRASERKPAAGARWLKKEWPQIKKVSRRQAHLVFFDAGGFLLLPVVRRTWAPRRRTSLLYHVGGYRPKVAALSAIIVSAKRQQLGLDYRFSSDRNIRWPEILACLRVFVHRLPGYSVVLWDRSKPKQATAIQAFLQRDRKRLGGEWFPAVCACSEPR